MATLVATYPNAKDPASPLDIRPIGGRIGAIIAGVELSGDLDIATIQAIEAAVIRHKVVFFRDQQHLDNAEHEALTALFGDPVAHPTVPVADGSNYLLELDSKEGYAASSWHTDVTFVDAYPKASILRALTVPEAGGDTVWANGETAYDGLPEPLRQLANNLWAVHTNNYDYAAVLGAGGDVGPGQQKFQQNHKAVFASTIYETEHPVVRVHPVSGRGNRWHQAAGLSTMMASLAPMFGKACSRSETRQRMVLKASRPLAASLRMTLELTTWSAMSGN